MVKTIKVGVNIRVSSRTLQIKYALEFTIWESHSLLGLHLHHLPKDPGGFRKIKT